jgi:hypothetical protein
MPAYLVRLIGNRDLVGFFAAEDLDDLVEAVDECTDVDACEFIELPPGGIMWTSPAICVPLERADPNDEDSQFPDFPWGPASLTEWWFDVVYGYDTDEVWTPLVPGAPREPPLEPAPRPIGPGQVIKMRKRGE